MKKKDGIEKKDNVRNFVKNLYFILIQICFSQLKYITQHVFFEKSRSFHTSSVCQLRFRRSDTDIRFKDKFTFVTGDAADVDT